MPEIRNHKDLELYKVSMSYVIQIYKITTNFPKEEQFGLTAQIRSAAVSIPSNISEGAARKNIKEFIQFLYCSLGSAAELETQLELAKKLDYYHRHGKPGGRFKKYHQDADKPD